MKKIGIVTTTVLSVALLAMAPLSFAQQDDKHGKPDRQDKHAQAQHGQQDRHAQAPPKQQSQRPQRPNERAQPTRDNHAQGQQAQPHPQRGDFQGQRARNFDREHQTWTQRGGYNGYRIPDSRFHSHFGRDHSFRLSSMPYMGDGGRLRFQYGGYWMMMMDPYPEYWGTSWYQSDTMYVDFSDGGYYLYDRRYPGRPGVALSISF